MNFQINEAVIKALLILTGKNATPNQKTNSYPGKVLVLQDSSINRYVDLIQQLYCDLTNYSNSQTAHLEWQLRQLYRALNAAAYSVHSTMQPYKKPLRELLKAVESSSIIQSWLLEIASKMSRDLICTGHGAAYLSDGYIKKFHGCQLITYAPIGSTLEYSTATAIENGVFDKSRVYIHDTKTKKSFYPKDYNFPQSIDQSSLHKMPDMRLESDHIFRARVLEHETNRALWSSKNNIILSAIMKKFPNAILHWASCFTVYEAENTPDELTPNANYLIYFTSKENVALYPNEEYLRKLRASSTKITLNQSLRLFSPKRANSLDPEIKEELKRKKLNPRDL